MERTHLLEPGWAYVVDDAAPARRFAEWHLRRLGWRVFSFADAASLLEALAFRAPEAILLDIGLPDGSGQVIAARLRRNSATAKLQLVAYTGLAAEDRAALTDAGFDAVIAKPGGAVDFARELPPPRDAGALSRRAAARAPAPACEAGAAA